MPRIEVLSRTDDGRAREIERILREGGKSAAVRVIDVYTAEHAAAESVSFINALANPVTQDALLAERKPSDYAAKLGDFSWVLEIGYLPGVTDNVGHTAQELLELTAAGAPPLLPPLAGGWSEEDRAVYSSRLYLIDGALEKNDIEKLAGTLANPLIQRIHIKSRETFERDGGMDEIVPKVHLDNKSAASCAVDLEIDDEALEILGREGITGPDGVRRGPLGLSLLYLKAIQAHFRTLGRNPSDIELETLAQTWSEHCKHTIFASPIDDIKDGLYRHYIKRATAEIRKKRGKDDICVSVFSDNAGAIIFDENWLITDKVETHNSPSALDPFGGAITGIVGVNRDCIGFGQGAKPVINRYGYCFADPRTAPAYYRDKNLTNPVLSPRTIMTGVVHGVNVGGNCSGIPTPQGFAYFDERYIGKPLVFVGTVGLIPREINGMPAHEKKARPGDAIVMAGGRVGRDGIHGATFSSVALDEGSPATAVQIGDPVTQKKMSDALVKEIREKGWYNAITDNGAGGLSSSVGEMAEQSGGFHVELEKVPLKYPGMAPWEIWISESQERMTLAVPPENTGRLIEFLARRGVEATVIGTFTDTGKARITWHGETVMDMDMTFLHDGLPETPLDSIFTPGGESEPELEPPGDYGALLLHMLARLNICSKEFIATQYDHEVQAGSVLKPLQGPGRVFADATITKPLPENPRGAVLSQALVPRYGDIDTKHMAACALDMAVRQAVAAGADFGHLALLDNFCWCSSDEPGRLGQLKRAVEAIYDLAVRYETPFISGKDSMFNDFKGFDAQGKPVKISAPPTLLISSIGVIPDVVQSISLAPKAPGDLVYLLGTTRDELGGSEYYAHTGHLGRNVPKVDSDLNLALYKLYSAAARKNLIVSGLSIGLGGIGIALAKKAIAGQMGLNIDLQEFKMRPDTLLFSESQGRFLVTVDPDNKGAFESHFGDTAHKIGEVTDRKKLRINNILEAEIKSLDQYYKATLKDY